MKNRILALIVLTCFGISGLSGCGRTGQEEFFEARVEQTDVFNGFFRSGRL